MNSSELYLIKYIRRIYEVQSISNFRVGLEAGLDTSEYLRVTSSLYPLESI